MRVLRPPNVFVVVVVEASNLSFMHSQIIVQSRRLRWEVEVALSAGQN